jgi:choline kinase
MTYKVFISSAGIGSRLKAHTSFRNKGLVTLGLKPAISLIIEKFNENIPIVIAVGYEKESLIEVILEMYPSREIEFINVDNFDGPNSGLGYSMLCCEQALQCPFIFIPNDTILATEQIDLNPNITGNWVGLFKNDADVIDPSHYRCAETIDNSILSILPKGLNTENIYIGLCGINDYQDFWKAMRSSSNAITEGESFGLNKLNNKKSIYFKDWHDTGNLNTIQTAFEKFSSVEHNILPKKEEAIWIFEDKCIKYHKDKAFIQERIKRMNFMPTELLPQIQSIGENFFSYKFCNGDLLARHTDTSIFKNFLDEMQTRLWKNQSTNHDQAYETQEEFYRKKTVARVKLYLHRFDQVDNVNSINGNTVKPVKDILANFNWPEFYKGAVWTHFHGYLHGENIIFDNVGKFKLLDWRQNFGNGNYEFGDVYYDLAKIMHGLIVRHSIVNEGRFSIDYKNTQTVNIDIDNTQSFFDLQAVFSSWLEDQGYSLSRVHLVTALIFINIAALHHYPYSKFIYLLGQLQLNKYLSND